MSKCTGRMKECFLMVRTVLFNWQCLITLITPENKICSLGTVPWCWAFAICKLSDKLVLTRKDGRWSCIRSSGHNRHWRLTNLIGFKSERLRKVGTIKASTTNRNHEKKILTGIIWKNLKYIHLILRGNLTLFGKSWKTENTWAC